MPPEIAFMLTVLFKRTEPSRPFNTGLNAAGSPAGSDHIVRPKSACFGLGCRIVGSRSPRGGQRRRSLYLEEQLARLPHQFSNVRAFRNSLASIAAMLKRVLVASRGARSQRDPMHATAPLAMDRW